MPRIEKSGPRRSLAALLREARTTHILAIRPQLVRRGFEDMPRGGVFAISVIRDFDVSAGDLGRRMGISKQAISQLLDTLVMRGYVERSTDTVDRRRTKLRLTPRGASASSVCREAVDQIERQLVEKVGTRCVDHARTALAALIDLAEDVESGAPRSTTR